MGGGMGWDGRCAETRLTHSPNSREPRARARPLPPHYSPIGHPPPSAPIMLGNDAPPCAGAQSPPAMSTPPEIACDDLRDPVLSDAQRGAMKYAAANEPALALEPILAEAAARTGLDGFGPPDFRERLEVLIQAILEDEGLGPLGRLSMHADLVRYAANRQRLFALLARHPEIHEVELSAPIIIVGLPRSGTTHLVNLIASDPRLRSMPYWESREPVAVPGEPPDARIERCREVHAASDALLPQLKAMHDMTAEHVHEEIELQAVDFSSYIPEWLAHVPRWRDYYLAHDQRPHYRFLKTALQAVQWQRPGPVRWILKSPQHLEQLGPLIETFPDATVAITHRDPISVVASAATMLSYGDRVRRTAVAPPQVAAYWAERVEQLLRACARDRHLLPAAQSIDVLFHEFMADDIGMVGRIYEVAGLPLSAADRQHFERYMTENPRNKHGRIAYQLERDLELDVAALAQRFEFYYERFGVRREHV